VVSIDLTENTSSVIDFMNSVKATGGADTCEDVFGGLEKVINLSWKNPNRILIHVGDAPQHGTRYSWHAMSHKTVRQINKVSVLYFILVFLSNNLKITVSEFHTQFLSLKPLNASIVYYKLRN
jgi:hypothetical protein